MSKSRKLWKYLTKDEKWSFYKDIRKKYSLMNGMGLYVELSEWLEIKQKELKLPNRFSSGYYRSILSAWTGSVTKKQFNNLLENFYIMIPLFEEYKQIGNSLSVAEIKKGKIESNAMVGDDHN